MIETKIDLKRGLVFRLKKEKTITTNSFSKRYVYSWTKTRNSYDDILSNIPKWKGIVIIYGKSKNHIEPIDCVYSNFNLRDEFLKGLKTTSDRSSQISRFNWMTEILDQKHYTQLIVCISSSFNINGYC